MLFLIIIGIFLVAITFFHSLQGFFSATISAILTVFSAVIAVAYHESVVEGLLGGKVADEAHAMVLLALFAITYLILRTVFDNVVKGNVRLPAALDKAGTGIMGLVAAIFATGVMAVAAQELPFAVSVGGYARYDVQEDRPLTMRTTGKSLDRNEYSELTSHEPGKFGEEGTSHGVAILPVDNILIGAVVKLSNGALSAGKPFNTIHPDFLDELFGQRMGLEAGTNHVAMNLPDKHLEAASVVGLYSRAFPPTAQYQRDAEPKDVRTGGNLKPITLLPSQTFLVVRVTFKLQAADSDHLFRFSPGGARLVIYAIDPQKPATSEPAYTDFYPVGTLQDAKVLFLNKLDDFLFVPFGEGEGGVDLVYKVPKVPNPKDLAHSFEADKTVPPGTFLEIKRLARVDLAGMDINPGAKLKADAGYNPKRKLVILAPPPPPDQNTTSTPTPDVTPTPTPGPTPTPTPTPTPEATATTFTVTEAVGSDALPASISAPAGAEASLVQVPGGTAVVVGGKLKVANLDSTQAEQNLAVKVTQFAIPDGMAMVQVSGTPSTAAPWGFASEPESYEIVDAAMKKYQPYGVFAKYDSKGAERIYLRYIDATSISGQAAPDGAGRPKQIVLFYLVPVNTALTEFDDHGTKVHDLSLTSK